MTAVYRFWGCLALLVGLALGVTGIGSDRSIASSAPSRPWQWQNPLPQGNALTAVSCPDTQTCYAVGSGTIMLSHDGGQNWAVTFDRPDGLLAGLTCPDHVTCYAIADYGANSAAVLGTRDGGATWTRLWTGTGRYQFISCPTAANCYVAGTYVEHLLITKDGGQTWDVTTPPFQPVSLACPTATTCYAPMNTNLVTSPPPSVAVTSDGGGTWSLQQVGLAKGGGELGAIQCATATACVLLGYGSDSALYREYSFWTTDGGRTWGHSFFPQSVAFRGAALSCPGVTICYLGGDNGVTKGVFAYTANGGRTWSAGRPLAFVPAGMFCVNISLCLLVGNGGAILRTANGFQTRTQVTHNALQNVSPNPWATFHAAACPAQRVCYAAGDFSAVAKTTDGIHWHAVNGPRWGGASITTLACPSPTTCYAGRTTLTIYRDAVYSTRDGGQSWSANPGNGWAVVACPGRYLCFAGGSKGKIEVTRDGGRNWRAQRTPLDGQQYEIQHIVCPTPRICYATAMGPEEPPPHPSSNVGALLITQNGGRSWQALHTDPYPFALACRTARACFALVAGALVNGTVPALRTNDGGATWTKLTTFPPGYWHSATCPSPTTCYLAGSGAVTVTRDGGQTWQVETVPTFGDPEAVRCVAADTCYAVGQQATILKRS